MNATEESAPGLWGMLWRVVAGAITADLFATNRLARAVLEMYKCVPKGQGLSSYNTEGVVVFP